MAEPVRKLPDEDKPVTRPNLRGIRGGGEGDGIPRGNLRSAEASGGDGGFYNPGGDKSAAPSDLKDAEESVAASTEDGGLYNDQARTGRFRKLRGRGLLRNRKLIAGGALLGGGIVASIVAIFFMLIPLKIEHIVTNLQNRFFATSENAVSQETENMLSVYVKKRVLPALTKCSGVSIDKNCNPAIGASNNPVTNMYRGWSNAKLENKLAENYGIEFRYDKASKKYYMKAPGIKNPSGDDITKFVKDPAEVDKDLFQQVSRGGARQGVRDALQNETKWNQVMYRYKVGKLLEEKYGIKRCIIFCGSRDALADFNAQKKNAAKIFLTQRVIVPRTETLGIVLECLMSPSCSPETTQTTTPQDGSTGELQGSPENAQVDTQARTTLEELANSYGIADRAVVEGMIKDYQTISEQGYSKYLLGGVLDKVGLSEFSSQIADKVGVVNWVNSAADLIVSLQKVGPKLKKLKYVTNSAAAVSLYMAYRTYADEIHTGHVDSTEVGSMINSLGSGNSGATNDPVLGGTATAESTPLYQSIISGGSDSAGAMAFDNLMGAPAYAASASNSDGSNNYLCNDGKPPSGIVCSEEVLGGGNKTANDVSNELNTPPVSYITAIADAWHAVFGGIFNFIGNIFGTVIGAIPGVSDLSSFAANAVQPFFDFLTNKLIPNPFSTNMSGGRTFDMMAAGANVAGNDACDQIGCQTVSSQTVADIINQQQVEQKQSFDHQSLLARIFSTDSQYSLTSQVAMAIPLDFQASAQQGFAGIMSNPFGSLFKGFGSILSGQQASADSVSADSVDPFQIGSKAFPADKIPLDPEAYWDSYHCDDPNTVLKWQQDAASGPTNPDTGMPQHQAVEPCLLIKHSSGDAGGLYDTSLLTPDEQGVDSGTTGAAPTSIGNYKNPFRGVQNLTPKRIDQGVDYGGSGPVYAIGNGQVVNTANPGWPGGTFIVYKLSDGPAQGKYVYMAENCQSIKVKVGDNVTPGTQLCSMVNSYPFIETGWADGSSLGNAFAKPDWNGAVDDTSHYTSLGENFSQLLVSLGAPAGTIESGAQKLGSLPVGWPAWQ